MLDRQQPPLFDPEQVTAALGGDTSPALRDFAAILFARGAAEDLARYRPECLAELARTAFEQLSERAPGTAEIRIWNPTGPGLDTVTVIEIVNDNMPFLVDSTMGELTDRSLDIRLVLHPILTVERDPSGRLAAFRGDALPRRGSAALRESLIHIHIERIESPLERQEIAETLGEVLGEVRVAVQDWKPMLRRVEETISAFQANPPPVPVDELSEAVQFLVWLTDNNFTFLGIRDHRIEEGALAVAPDSGLGLLRDPDRKVLRRDALDRLAPETGSHGGDRSPLIIAKSKLRSRVHRRVPMDYVGIKTYDALGRVVGERRIVGLFTSTAYTRSTRTIPYIRQRVDRVIARAGLDPESHSGKALLNVLENYPRDELFQIDEDTLYRFAMAILALDERPRIRVLARPDAFGRFVSALVFVPRDRYDTRVRLRIGEFLARAFGGRVSAASPSYPEGSLARVHFIVAHEEGTRPAIDQAALEAGVAEIVTTWSDRLRRAVQARFDPARAKSLLARYGEAFTPGYQETYAAETAVEDLERIGRLTPERDTAIDFHTRTGGDFGLKVYHLGEPISLSARLPVLENMGFTAIDESSFEIGAGGGVVWLHDITLRPRDGRAPDLAALDGLLEALFMAVWHGRAEDDGYNALVLEGLAWRDIAMLRAVGRYLRQALIPFSQDYIWATLTRHAEAAKLLVALFHARLDPHAAGGAEARSARERALLQELETALAAVTSLDEDRILRRFANAIGAMLRTNFFQLDASGQPPGTLAFKLDARRVEGLPAPRPLFEIFVYSPRVEGIHLRFGKIARGGIRWSDRPQDFRTEVLGLVKAQQVKNAVIVPVGAKGGFVPKHLPSPRDREAFNAEGVATYRAYVGAMLDVTDNLRGTELVPPPDTVRHDGDDPYLVVAADKGTARMSDTANEIALSRGFWLGDAFASGGSSGYDHKGMGITARGAWEAVKRHFREMNRDVQREPFTAAGVGDMSGDVFGNGMLLSRATRLVAAFDHRDIFIDPDPDPETSHGERERLFRLPRSSWQDYDRGLISKGGGVWSRGEKAIALSPEARVLLGLAGETATPQEVMSAILRAQVDLLWFGGIGTFVRSSEETDAEIGDRTNDAIRVAATELRARVIGEGANLGVSQRGRVEFARRGGRINTDAIDNSAGVNSSDVEVNIKIALAEPVREGRLDLEARNALLAEMTDEVASLVLRNNVLQTLAISLAERRGAEELGFQSRLMQTLEAQGLLDRAVEFLPGEAEIATRAKAGGALTRPEIAVLLAYAKLTLFDDLLESGVPDDAYFGRELMRYFPARLQEDFPEAIAAHRLRREIIATMLANSMINRGGPTLIVRLSDQTGATAPEIAAAFAATRDSFRLTELNGAIEALEGRIDGMLQLALHGEVQDLLLEQMVWMLRHSDLRTGVGRVVERYRAGIEALERVLDDVLPEDARAVRQARIDSLAGAGVPRALAERLAGLHFLAFAPDLTHCAEEAGADLERTAGVFFALRAFFGTERLIEAATRLRIEDYYDRLALDRSMAGLAEAERRLTVEALRTGEQGAAAVAAWAEARREETERTERVIAEIAGGAQLTLSRVAVAASQLGDLARARG